MKIPNFRSLWSRLHRWVALGLGWVLIVSGLTGAILVAARPPDRSLHPELFRARHPSDTTPPAIDMEPIAQAMRSEFGSRASFTLRPPREAGDTLWVLVRGPWNGTVYINPVTGQEQGRRGDTEGFVNTIFKLHSSLWSQDAGKAILAGVALAYLLLLTTGLILWWPRRWPPSWRIERNKGATRGLFDLHRVVGTSAGLFIMISVVTGAYMAWRPFGKAISAISDTPTTLPPLIAKEIQPQQPPLRLDGLIANAQARFPGTPIGYIHLPAQEDRPVRIRFILSDDPHPNGLSSVWLHPRRGEVLAVHRWNELDPGARAVAVIYPLHTGVLGGPLLEIVTALSGLLLVVLGISGIWLWWRRRNSGHFRSRQGTASASPLSPRIIQRPDTAEQVTRQLPGDV